MFALSVMEKLKIMHNDLHGNNILVMTLPTPVKMIFKNRDKTWLIETKYIPYIFDWDFSYSPDLGPNPKIIPEYIVLNMSNKFDDKFDLYVFLCYLSLNEYILKYNKQKLSWDLKKLAQFHLDKTSTWKENQKGVLLLTLKQYNLIEKYNPIAHENIIMKIESATTKKVEKINVRFGVYKLTGEQIRSIIPRFFADDLENILFKLGEYNDTQGTRRYILIAETFQCRPATRSRKFPTPLQLLDKGFNELLIPAGSIPPVTPFVYNMPL